MSCFKVGRVLAPIIAGVFIAGAVVLSVARPAVAVEESSLIPCPPYIPANGLMNSHWVPQFQGVGSEVPFTSTGYDYKRGVASSGRAWYWPIPRTTTWQGMVFEWMDAGVEWSCRRVFFPPMYVDTYLKGSQEGYALVIPDAAGPNVGNTEMWYPSDGYIGGGGETSQEECYDIWIMEYVEGPNGWLVLDVYPTGYEVCYQNGNMT